MAMKTFNVGDILAAADVNEYLVNTKFVIKPGDTTRNNTSAVANDPDLLVSVDANKTYYLEAVINYLSGATPGFRCTFTVPASATFAGTVTGLAVGQAYMAMNGLDVNGSTQITGTFGAAGAALGDLTVRYSGVLITAGAAGTLQFQWAQATATVANTICRQGSFLLLRRCA